MSFTLFRIKFVVTFPFAALLSLIFLFDKSGLASPAVFAVLVHECGHLLAMALCRVRPTHIKFVPCAVEINRPRKVINTCATFFISLNGSAVGFLMAALFFACHNMVWGAVQLCFAVFNLLPINGLDGGEIVSMLSAERLRFLPALLNAFSIAILIALGAYIMINSGGIGIALSALYLLICAMLKTLE